jgi:hypothetical protein
MKASFPGLLNWVNFCQAFTFYKVFLTCFTKNKFQEFRAAREATQKGTERRKKSNVQTSGEP